MERSLVQLTRRELLALARDKKIKGYSSMKKDDLIHALGGNGEEGATPEPRPETNATEETPVLKAQEPKAPPQFPKTWVNYDLLIDEGLGDLPGGYNENKVVFLVIDPGWAHVYWDLSFDAVNSAHERGGKQLILRIYDVTDVMFNGYNAHSSFDIQCPDASRSWYLNLATSDRTYVADVGYLTDRGEFILLARSNAGHLPLGRPSDIIADKFVTIPWDLDLSQLGPELTRPTPGVNLAETMFDLSGGPSMWSESVQRFGPGWDSTENPSSYLFSAEFSGRGAERSKDFWLVADCELIVYGATEPDAAVTVCGAPIQLKPDGTFTMRFALPDGDHPIPIRAVNADGDMERSIKFDVTRETRVPATVA